MKSYSRFIATIMFVLGAIHAPSFVSAAENTDIDSVSCECKMRFVVMTDAQHDCIAENKTPAQCGVVEGGLTQLESEQPITKLGLAHGANFGPYIGQAILVQAADISSPGNITISSDGEVLKTTKGKDGDSVDVYWLLPKQVADAVYQNASLVGPDEEATNKNGWTIDYSAQPICIPSNKVGNTYKWQAYSGQYAIYKIGCNDILNAKVIPENSEEEKQIDPLVYEAQNALNRIGSTDVSEVLGKAISVIMGIMGSIALAMFVYAGFLFMVSGTTDSVEKARSILVWSSMGIVVVFASYALVQLIFATF